MSLEIFITQLKIWQTSNADVPESTQFQDFVESLKINKEVKGLAKYVGVHILIVLNAVERQKIKEVIELSEKRY